MASEDYKFNYKNRDLLFEDAFWRLDLNKKQHKSLVDYFETGDLDKYLADEQFLLPYICIYYSPNHDFEDFKARFQKSMDWFVDNPNSPALFFGYEGHEPGFRNVISRIHGKEARVLEPELWAEVYQWYFPEPDPEPSKFSFPLSFGKSQWRPEVPYTRDSECMGILGNIGDYCFYPASYISIDRLGYTYLLSRLPSMLPKMPKQTFEFKHYGRNHKIMGKPTFWGGYQNTIRRFLGHKNGIVSKPNITDGYNEVIVVQPEFHKKFMETIDSINMPDEYYQLEEKIISIGECTMNKDLNKM